MSKGTLLLGDLVLPVDEVALRGGRFHITATLRAVVDMEVDPGAPRTLHGPDGLAVVYQGPTSAPPVLLPAGRTMEITWALACDEIREG